MSRHEPDCRHRTPFTRAFYVANVMEIFERFAWYGFFTVSSLYLTTPVPQGGLGFSEQQRGVLQGLVPFFLYLLPVITGALGDRYGYRKMFIASFLIMAPSYYLLGKVTTFWAFLIVFMAVAVGAAMFKPLVVGTVSRTTDDSNRGLGFGIFYTMVNLGGFLGPIVAGAVRAVSWNLVFVCAAAWISVNLIPAVFLYRDPASAEERRPTSSLTQVLIEAQEVLGNGRLALTVVPLLALLMVGGGGWLRWSTVGWFAAGWLAFNVVWNAVVRDRPGVAWYARRTRIGNGPFVTYLLIMAGFWTVYAQVFNTLPIYIRDHVDTADLVAAVRAVSPRLAGTVASVDPAAVADELERAAAAGAPASPEAVEELRRGLKHHKVRVPVDEARAALDAIARDDEDPEVVATRWVESHAQVAPEYLMALTFLSILLFQILVSRAVERRREVHVLVAGTLLIGVGYLVTGSASLVAFGGALVVASIAVVSFGEMLASPKSQDYVAGVMPKARAAMFMGYYFVSMALGFLFGGVLSGWAYDRFCDQWHLPHLMWLLFAGLAAVTAFALVAFDRFVAPRFEASREF